jgi:hypothetical protein
MQQPQTRSAVPCAWKCFSPRRPCTFQVGFIGLCVVALVSLCDRRLIF